MSALDDVRHALTNAYGEDEAIDGLTVDDLINALRVDTKLDAEAYPGQLAMLIFLFRALRSTVRENDSLPEVRRLLWLHAHDDAAARQKAKEKSSPTGADATPAFFQPGHTYTEPDGSTDWKFRCDSVTTHPGSGERTALGWRHFRGEWEPCAYDEGDWEIHQIADSIDTRGDSK